MTQGVTESRRRLSERIAHDLQHEIVSQGLIPNLRLPTELELMERYGVSRSVVREAAKVLEQRGLVTVSPGRGMTVAKFDGARIAEQFSLLMLASAGTFDQLLELRLALEVQVASAVAIDPPTQALQELEESLAQGEAALDRGDEIDREEFLDADMRFHETMALASGNPFFELVCRPINTFLRSHYQHRDGYPSDPARTLEEHREILDALRRRDTLGARQAVEEHLRRLTRRWRTVPDGFQSPSVRQLSAQDDSRATPAEAEGAPSGSDIS
ncbi:FadR/GntR family transcriptional regulator [Pseudoclavibacter sp. RFBB5]|uniref:FadR/GntR family transcriptional regulator n=1 Tax=Pseudoclavibacter sp. RFBB5 TaxID=2080574 RepID=UPI000CE87C7E|nr:FadR/GntR family transcriptional regulator [Pseudoclavibacter sp. RFBB5]PPG32102.1 FadR family transcriptional regulator [Pseudoclavibacter sp. RFBB5]